MTLSEIAVFGFTALAMAVVVRLCVLVRKARAEVLAAKEEVAAAQRSVDDWKSIALYQAQVDLENGRKEVYAAGTGRADPVHHGYKLACTRLANYRARLAINEGHGSKP